MIRIRHQFGVHLHCRCSEHGVIAIAFRNIVVRSLREVTIFIERVDGAAGDHAIAVVNGDETNVAIRGVRVTVVEMTPSGFASGFVRYRHLHCAQAKPGRRYRRRLHQQNTINTTVIVKAGNLAEFDVAIVVDVFGVSCDALTVVGVGLERSIVGLSSVVVTV